MEDISKYRPKFLKEKFDEKTKRNCVICKATLPSYLKYYCSGACLLEAKKNGTYGKEEASQA